MTEELDAIRQHAGQLIADSMDYKHERFRDRIDERANVIEAYESVYGQVELPTVCLALRMSCNGASDPWGNEFLAATVNYLRERCRLWLASSDIIDFCVYVMCRECIKLGEAELSHRKEKGWVFTGLEGEGWK